MTLMTPVLVILWFTLSSALPLEAEVIVERQSGETGKMSFDSPQRHGRLGKIPMRIEEPDGTLRPLPSIAIPESRLNSEGLRDVPDAGGGTMVNVEGRFQSILKVPDGADQAMHQHDSSDLQPLKP